MVFRRLRYCLLLSFLIAGGWVFPATAATKTDTSKSSTQSKSSDKASSSDISGAVTQSYTAGAGVETGMLVELDPKNPAQVVPLKNTDVKSLLGIVIPSDNATIVLTPQNVTNQQVLVANSGHYSLLVSNQNGAIKTGDYLAVSAIDGVAMKADADQEQVIGKAAGDFSGSANVIGQVDVADTTGHKSKIALGRVSIDISIAHNPLQNKLADHVPSFLAKAATTVASKPVSAARIYLGVVILFVTTIITTNMLYSGVRSGMIAVGRNPLSKKSIIRSLIQTVIAGLIIFIAGIFAVYLLLKL